MGELFKVREDYGALFVRDMNGEPLDLDQLDSLIARLIQLRSKMEVGLDQYDIVGSAKSAYLADLARHSTLHYPFNHPYIEYRPGKTRGPKQPRFTGVYFLNFEERPDIIKIGLSIDIYNRTKGLWSEYHHLLPVVHGWIETDDMRTMESALHERFENHRIESEWFKADPVMAWLKDRT